MSNPRFVVADAQVSQSLNQHTIVMLGDIGFWIENYDLLQQWCQDHGGKVEGMTVNIPNEQVLTAFCLRWS